MFQTKYECKIIFLQRFFLFERAAVFNWRAAVKTEKLAEFPAAVGMVFLNCIFAIIVFLSAGPVNGWKVSLVVSPRLLGPFL